VDASAVLGGPDATYTGTSVVRFHVPNPDPTLTVTGLTTGEHDATLAYFLIDGGKKVHGVVFLHGAPAIGENSALLRSRTCFPT